MPSEKEILKKSQEYAKSKGLKLNPNKKALKAIIAAIAKTEAKYGKESCPCRAVTGNAVEDEKILCPCAFHLQEIKETGHCRCGLFYAK